MLRRPIVMPLDDSKINEHLAEGNQKGLIEMFESVVGTIEPGDTVELINSKTKKVFKSAFEVIEHKTKPFEILNKVGR